MPPGKKGKPARGQGGSNPRRPGTGGRKAAPRSSRQGGSDQSFPGERGSGPNGSRTGKRGVGHRDGAGRESTGRSDRTSSPRPSRGARRTPDAIADTLADAARSPRPAGSPTHHNQRPGRGTRKGPHGKPSLGIFTTTLWTYPSQHYGERVQGDKNYVGATPAWVIWQLLKRYTAPGDLVIDPMCGSGTTIDVCEDLARRHACSDLAPTRGDIAGADARRLPHDDAAADFFFIDPPYSTHITYSDHPGCIGRLNASVIPGEDPALNAYYAAMTQVLIEADRVMKPGAHLGLYVSDSFKKGRPFMPIGFELFSIMRGRFEPVDIIAVVRGNEKLERGNFRKAAEEGNFFLRGFSYLFIMRKPGTSPRHGAGGHAGTEANDERRRETPARVRIRGRTRAISEDLARRARPAFPGNRGGRRDADTGGKPSHRGSPPSGPDARSTEGKPPRKRPKARDSDSPIGPRSKRKGRRKPGSR